MILVQWKILIIMRVIILSYTAGQGLWRLQRYQIW